jgi:hypothetical protein
MIFMMTMKQLGTLTGAGLVWAILSASAVAGPFTLTRSCGGNTSGPAFDACNRVLTDLERRVNSDLPEADASNYLKGMANASVMSLKGGSTDYANDIDLFVFGASVGIGADVGSNSFSDLVGGDVDGNQVRGVGFAPSILAGVNLGIFKLPTFGWFDPNNVKLMLNFFSMSLDSFATDLTGKSSNFGISARYRIVEPIDFVPRRMVRWNGVDLTTGLQFNTLDLKYSQKFDNEQVEVDDDGSASIDGTVVVGAKVSTTSIPIVASTSMQLGYILTTYGGLGFDLNMGSAKSQASLEGTTVTGNIDGLGAITEDASLNLGDKDSPSSLTGRMFFGVQFNLSVVKIYAQLDKGFSSGLYAANAGLRVTW